MFLLFDRSIWIAVILGIFSAYGNVLAASLFIRLLAQYDIIQDFANVLDLL